MLPLSELRAERIAFIKPSALGDIVHALPVLSALRGRFPAASITWVVNSTYEPLLQGHPDLTDTLPFDRGAFKQGYLRSIGYAFRFAAELRRRRFDLVVDLQGLLRTGLMTLASGASRRVGFANAREGSRYAYTDRIAVPDADRIHAVDRYWRVTEALGAGAGPKRFHVPLRPAEVEAAKADLARFPRPRLAFAVGARWLTKRWPAEHFAKLARRAQAESGGVCFFVGTAEDTATSQAVIARLSGPTQDFTGRTSLPRLAALLSLADVVVANDTGPLHLAAALGVPCVAPYTCTKTALHGPYVSDGLSVCQVSNLTVRSSMPVDREPDGQVGNLSYEPHHGAVETTVPCAGSYIKTCPKMICMSELTPDRLWGPLREVLHRCPRTSRSA